jgi:hypothetical protein
MIKSKELAGPSCLTSAADDEPLFVLRANDELAPDVVRSWANRYWLLKTAGNTMQPTKQQVNKFREAIELAAEMREWRKTRVKDA